MNKEIQIKNKKVPVNCVKPNVQMPSLKIIKMMDITKSMYT